MTWKGHDRSVERPEGARWSVAKSYCNRCVGEQGEDLEESRMKHEPRYRATVLRKREKALRRSDKNTEKRRARRERRDEEPGSAWGIVDVARLFAEE